MHTHERCHNVYKPQRCYDFLPLWNLSIWSSFSPPSPLFKIILPAPTRMGIQGYADYAWTYLRSAQPGRAYFAAALPRGIVSLTLRLDISQKISECNHSLIFVFIPKTNLMFLKNSQWMTINTTNAVVVSELLWGDLLLRRHCERIRDAMYFNVEKAH